MRDHRLIDERSVAFAQAIADRLRKDPSLIQLARTNLANWMKTCSPRTRPTFEEWLAAVNGPIEGVFDLLTSRDERATRLRQSNPFAGALPESERTKILLEYQARDKAAT